jgi:Na+/melibiose symporter-like transporter
MKTKLAFGVGAAAEAAISIAFNTWNFLFYNNVLGLSGTLCGLAVTIALVFDAISDPVVGSISDRWKSKLGRRHPFLYFAALPLGVSFYLIYVPPAGLTGVPLFVWFTFFAVMQRQFMTFYQVPHLALGAELSTDYRERTVVMSYNSIFAVVGGAGTYFCGWTWLGHVTGGSSVRAGYPGLAGGVGLFAAVVIFLSAHFTRDQVPRLAQPRADAPRFGLRELVREIKSCFSNRNYAMLLIGLLFLSATTGTRETIGSYMSLFYWGLPEDKIRVFGLITPPAFVVAFIVTVRMHARFDKRNTILAAVIVMMLAASTPIFLRMVGVFPVNGAPTLIPTLLFFVFFFYGSGAVLSISVLSALADIADEHELSTGLRQEGVFFAARTFFAKLTSGLGHILAGIAVDVIHFPVGAKPGSVGADVLWKLGLIDGPIASAPALFALVFYARYGIDKHRHAEIRLGLAERRGAASVATVQSAGAAVDPVLGADH